jgi:septum formation protein
MTLQLYLASASPRRSELLTQLGVRHVVLTVPAVPGEDEPRHPNESPLAYVQRTAHDKADRCIEWLNRNALHPDDKQASNNSPQGLNHSQQGLDQNLYALTADTTVALGDQVLGKPADQEDARKTLSLLSNQTHLVHTAVVLCRGQERLAAISTSKVTFTALSAQDIEQYIATQEPFGKAGAYGIQGLAAQYICQLEGSYTGVMGLPLFETAQLLKKAGIL